MPMFNKFAPMCCLSEHARANIFDPLSRRCAKTESLPTDKSEVQDSIQKLGDKFPTSKRFHQMHSINKTFTCA
jgi:hypothetical protein